MKTFKTEKHNIPEGATHYRDECKEYQFSWVKFASDSMYLWCETYWDETSDYIFECSVKPIPQTNIEAPEEKEVEWENGELLEYKDEDDEWDHNGRYVCFDGYGKHHVFTARDGMMYCASDEQIRKPETEAERVDRERLEAAYDLYCHVHNENSRPYCDFDSFKLYERSNPLYKVIVNKTGYRKEN